MTERNDDSFKTLLYEVDEDGILTLTINRPDKLNALNQEVLNELDEVISSIIDNREIRAVVLTGSGDKAFVAGADIKELRSLDQSSGQKLSKKGQAIFKKIEELSIPVIAAVNGYALGGGAELALACHIRIANSKAVFGLPEVSLGLIPGYGGTQRLAQLVGRSTALEMILTGRHVQADEAEKKGLISLVVSNSDVVSEAKNLLKNMLKNAPLALAHAIQAVNSTPPGLIDGFDIESELFGQLCETSDFREGTGAFLEKRKPDFKGE